MYAILFAIVSLFWFGNVGVKVDNPWSILEKLLSPGRVKLPQLNLPGSEPKPRFPNVEWLKNNFGKKTGLVRKFKIVEWIVMDNNGKKAFTDTDKKYFRSLGSREGKKLFPAPRFPTVPTPGLRKEYRCLTDRERQNLHDAFNAMKSKKVGDQTQYDIFVLHHIFKSAPGAHWGPAFLPWHRIFLHRWVGVRSW